MRDVHGTQWRMLPSASVPPSTGTPGLWRRKSGIGAVDAQGLGLTHPMTWIDERLFGWSRSANRGTSAWGGFSGDESSRVGTPDDTDDEEAGDYDDVIKFLPVPSDPTSGNKSRSRQSSYADLQRLRLSPLAPATLSPQSLTQAKTSPTAETEGLQFHGHRNRRESLSDRVAVERIASVDPQEQFDHVTKDLNEEIQQEKGTA